MRTNFILALFFSFISIGSQAQSHIQPSLPKPQFGPDTFLFNLNYDSADAHAFHLNSQSYLHNQRQLMNTNYRYPYDTTRSYKSSIFNQNYDCINYVVVAFDSLYDPYTTEYFYSGMVNSIGIDAIYVPVITYNTSNTKDTIKIELNMVDQYGYPVTSSFVADTTIFDSNVSPNDSTVTLIKWSLNMYNIAGSKFAVTVRFSGPKQDSCWFMYGYGSFPNSCHTSTSPTTLAYPTHFSEISNPKPHPFMANSFALWNPISGNGIIPEEGGENNFFPCPTNDVTFHPGQDGDNYFENINIFASLYVYQTVGIPAIYNPVATLQDFPNPFTSITNLNFTLNQPGYSSLVVTDITGRELYNKDYGLLASGNHSEVIDGTGLVPGIYFYTLNVDGYSLTGKMVKEL